MKKTTEKTTEKMTKNRQKKIDDEKCGVVNRLLGCEHAVAVASCSARVVRLLAFRVRALHLSPSVIPCRCPTGW